MNEAIVDVSLIYSDDSENSKGFVYGECIGELVRCGDCKNFKELHDGVGVCERDENSDRDRHDVCGLVNGNWFCADGERKKE